MFYSSTPLELVEIKADPSGKMEFSAYASTFGNKDHGGDIIQKGAFAATLKERKFRPLLWQHDMSKPIGIERSIREDSKGLLGTWELADTAQGLEAYKLLKMGAVRSMSIGYIPKDFSLEFADGNTDPLDATRILKEVDLLENSVVSLPMNEQAQVQHVKAHHVLYCEECMAGIDALDAALKATWDSAYVNALPDSAFALVYTDDAGNKQRKLPHHAKGGAIDLPHLRNALARAPQMTGVSDAQRSRAVAHLERHARAEGVGDSGKSDHTHEDDEEPMPTYEEMTLRELAGVCDEITGVFRERTKDLLDKLSAGDFSLTDAKRADLEAAVETFSGLDAVRQQAEAILAHTPTEPAIKGTSAIALAIQLRRARLRREHGIEV